MLQLPQLHKQPLLTRHHPECMGTTPKAQTQTRKATARLETLSPENHICGKHSFSSFGGVSAAFLSDLSTSPSCPLALCLCSLSPWGLWQRTAAEDGRDGGHLTSFTALAAEWPHSHPPSPTTLHYLSPPHSSSPHISSVLSTPKSWCVGALADPKKEEVSELVPQKTPVFKASLVLPG